jgi:hypothetical protein
MRLSRLNHIIAISLCVAGCSNRLEREQAERENALSAERNADLAQVVNEARPLMAWGNEARAIVNRMETDRAPAEAANNKVGSK